MTRFISLLTPQLMTGLSKKGISHVKTDEILEELRKLSLFQFVILLYPSAQSHALSSFSKTSKNREVLPPKSNSIEDKTCLFFTGSQEEKKTLDKEILKQLLEVYANKYGYSEEDTEKAFELIISGVAQKDTRGIIEDTALTLKQLPPSLRKIIFKPVSSPLSILRGVFRDIAKLPKSSKTLLNKFLKSNPNSQKVKLDNESILHFNNTLNSIFEIAVLEDLREWAATILSYDSIQLALIAYASTQGIEISKDDIEKIISFLHDGDPEVITTLIINKLYSKLIA